MLAATHRACALPATGVRKRVRALASPRSDGSRLIFDGNAGRDSRPSGPDSGRLILPGQSGPGARPGKLIVGGDKPSQLGGSLEGPSAAGAPPIGHQFRPPPGFMNSRPADDPTLRMEPREMMARLRARSGLWHQLAKLIPALQARGFDSSAIDEASAVTPLEQNSWVVAGTVYDSLAAGGDIPPPILAHFDNGGDALLYPFRFLSVAKRSAAARYIVANDLSSRDCEVLARAMKEWERRPTERKGFSDSPGDCLAFKALRDAGETRYPEEAAQKVALGLSLVESQGARQRLEALVAEQEAAAEAGGTGARGVSRAVLQVLRLAPEELGFRPLPQVRPLGELSADEVRSAPRTQQRGAFGAFTVNGAATGRCTWVALPQWTALQFCRHPVAVPLVDCAKDGSVMRALGAKSEEDRRRLRGAGLLVVDAHTDGQELEPDSFYLAPSSPSSSPSSDSSSSPSSSSSAAAAAAAAAVQGSSGGGNGTQQPEGGDGCVELVEGRRLAGDGVAPVAKVLFLARPPDRESSAITSTDMLQL